MFSRELYNAVGGFDSAYGLGYYEDTDLAMQVRQKGLEVVFQPLAVVSGVSLALYHAHLCL
jgi:GT2 family glycosyltransferase